MLSPEQVLFWKQVQMELQMTQEELQHFGFIELYDTYKLSIINHLRREQINLFLDVAEFDKGVKSVKDIQQSLKTYLQLHPQYQDNNYISIWCKLAHEYYLSGKKIQIKFGKKSIEHSSASSGNRKNRKLPQVQPKVEEIELDDDYDDDDPNDPDYIPQEYEEDEDELENDVVSEDDLEDIINVEPCQPRRCRQRQHLQTKVSQGFLPKLTICAVNKEGGITRKVCEWDPEIMKKTCRELTRKK